MLYEKIKTGIKKLLKNPVYIKDLCQWAKNEKSHFQNRMKTVYLAAIILIIISGATGAVSFSGTMFVYFVIFQIFFYTYRACIQAGGLIIREKESGTLDCLFSTMLTTDDIIIGKFMFVFYPLFIELTWFFPLFMIGGIVCNISILPMFLIYFITLANIAAGIVFGLKASVCADSFSNAKKAADSLTIVFLAYQFYYFINLAIIHIFLLYFKSDLFAMVSKLSQLIDHYNSSIWPGLLNPFSYMYSVLFRWIIEGKDIQLSSLNLLFIVWAVVAWGLIIYFQYRQVFNGLNPLRNIPKAKKTTP
ncbi:MAG: ABC transporter permease [Firmicutes bacterium]|nr:ABC transporter permease [Bacillota bacterium]